MSTTPRRGFLARALGLAAAAGSGALARTASALDVGDQPTADPWTRRVTAKHRVVFHSHEPTGGLALRWARTFLDTQKASYGLRDADSTVIVALNGKSIGLVFNDTLWKDYPVATALAMAGTVNPAGPSGTDDVAKLIARGVIVLVCNNSLQASGQRFLPEATRGDAAARSAFADTARRNLLAGVEITPAMVVTLQQAQDLGCRYVYAGG